MNTNKSATLFETEQFHEEWQEDDDKAPPGYKLAKYLLFKLKESGASSSIVELEEDYWEHQNWYFWITWNDLEYNLRVESSLDEEKLWFIGISKRIGIFKALFRNGKERDNIDLSLRDATTTILKHIANSKNISWLEHDDALDILNGTNKKES